MADVAIGTVRRTTSRASRLVTRAAVVVPPLGQLSAAGLLSGVALSPVDADLVCHVLGPCAHRSRDERRTNRVVATLTLGEEWHTDHHAFPRTARHRLDGRQPDLACSTIRGLEHVWPA